MKCTISWNGETVDVGDVDHDQYDNDDDDDGVDE